MALPPQPRAWTPGVAVVERIKSTEDYFYASLNDWEAQLVAALNGMNNALGTAPPEKEPARATAEKNVRVTLENLRREIFLAKNELDVVTNVLQMRKASAEEKGAVVSYWPDDVVSRQLMYLGAILFGAGGLSTAIGNYLFGGLGFAFTVAATAGGVIVFFWGLAGLSWDQRQKWGYYANRFRLVPDARADWTRPTSPRWRPW